MSSIAIAGKGGTGKTTLAGLLVRCLVESGRTPVLAIDADPNSNLNEALGVDVDRTVVSAVEEVMDKKGELAAGITKERLLEYHLGDVLIEKNGFDLLVMGHTEGPGCYCTANNILRGFMDRLRKNYPYTVMDNEAGMEHLSRRTTREVDYLLITAGYDSVSLKTSGRIFEMAQKLKLKIKREYLVINETQPDADFEKNKYEIKLPLLGVIPYDNQVRELSLNGQPLINLSSSSAAIKAAKEIIEKLIIQRD